MTQDECRNLDELIATMVRYHPEANVELVEERIISRKRRTRGSSANPGNRTLSIR